MMEFYKGITFSHFILELNRCMANPITKILSRPIALAPVPPQTGALQLSQESASLMYSLRKLFNKLVFFQEGGRLFSEFTNALEEDYIIEISQKRHYVVVKLCCQFVEGQSKIQYARDKMIYEGLELTQLSVSAQKGAMVAACNGGNKKEGDSNNSPNEKSVSQPQGKFVFPDGFYEKCFQDRIKSIVEWDGIDGVLRNCDLDGQGNLALKVGADVSFTWSPTILPASQVEKKVYKALAYQIWCDDVLQNAVDDIAARFRSVGPINELGGQLKIDIVPIYCVYKRIMDGVNNLRKIMIDKKSSAEKVGKLVNLTAKEKRSQVASHLPHWYLAFKYAKKITGTYQTQKEYKDWQDEFSKKYHQVLEQQKLDNSNGVASKGSFPPLRNGSGEYDLPLSQQNTASDDRLHEVLDATGVDTTVICQDDSDGHVVEPEDQLTKENQPPPLWSQNQMQFGPNSFITQQEELQRFMQQMFSSQMPPHTMPTGNDGQLASQQPNKSASSSLGQKAKRVIHPTSKGQQFASFANMDRGILSSDQQQRPSLKGPQKKRPLSEIYASSNEEQQQ